MPKMYGNAKILRRTLIWMFVALFAVGGAFMFEHDSGAKGVLLDSPTLVKNDGTCDGGSKPNCTPCPDNANKNCKEDPCAKGNGDEKNCVPCPESTGHNGEAKKCKPCKTDENGDPQQDKNGNHKPHHCVFSGEEFGQHPDH
jgi:hypothetical protein